MTMMGPLATAAHLERVSQAVEVEGLDINLHGEVVQ